MQSNHLYIEKAAIKTLLTAIDETMNSNTVFLKVQADTLLTISNCRDELSTFLHSLLFREMMFELDQQREWYNYTRWDVTNDGRAVLHSPTGKLVKEHVELMFTPMDERQFAERLHWMLREAFRPYQPSPTEKQTQEMIRDFFQDVFAPESWPLGDPSASGYWRAHSWFFSDVKPNFLYTRGYNERREANAVPLLPYFDGGESDTCTFFYEADVFYLFFTNGSP